MSRMFNTYFSLPVIIVMAMLLLQYPYIVVYFFPFLPGEAIIVPLFIVLTSLVNIGKKQVSMNLPSSIVVCMILQAIGWLCFCLFHGDTSYINRTVFILLGFTSLLMLVNQNRFGQFLVVNHWWMCLQAIGGAIAFVLVLSGLLQPLQVIMPDDFRVISFYGITCSNSVLGNFIRAGGFFDEPGALASWGIFCMLLNKLTYNNKHIELLMMFGLVFTFSAAYFVLVTMFILLFYGTKIRSSIIYVLLASILIGAVFYGLRDNEQFRYMTTERFEGGKIRSKRDIAEEAAEKIFNEHMLIGVGARNLEKVGEVTSDNPYEILAKDGIVGFLITYLPLLFLIIKYRTKKDVVFSTMILMASYMQRPFHINMMHFFMLYTFMLAIESKYNNKYQYLINV